VNCKRCNRILKSQNSISLGYGPTCAKLEGIIKPKQSNKKYKGVDILKWIEN